MLADVREALRHHEVRRRLDRVRAAARPDVATTSTGTVAREARSWSAAGSPRFVRMAGWMPRARSRSSFSARLASSPARRTSSAAAGSPVHGALLGHAQVQRERHEPLLCAVVQVALDPAPLGVGRGDDARARVLELRAPAR